MDELRNILEANLNKDFLAAVLSNPRNKDQAVKVKVRPVKHKGQLVFQTETFQNKQVFHENLNAVDTAARLMEYMGNFRQIQIRLSKTGLIEKIADNCVYNKRRNRIN